MEWQLSEILQRLADDGGRNRLLFGNVSQQQRMITELIEAARHTIGGPTHEIEGFRREDFLGAPSRPREAIVDVVERPCAVQRFEADMGANPLIERFHSRTSQCLLQPQLPDQHQTHERPPLFGKVRQNPQFLQQFLRKLMSLIADQNECFALRAEGANRGHQFEPQFLLVLLTVRMAQLTQDRLQQRAARQEAGVTEQHRLKRATEFTAQSLAQQCLAGPCWSRHDRDPLPLFNADHDLIQSRLHRTRRQKALRIRCRCKRTPLQAEERFIHETTSPSVHKLGSTLTNTVRPALCTRIGNRSRR